jgi:apolipoprotein N-acyltransferase
LALTGLLLAAALVYGQQRMAAVDRSALGAQRVAVAAVQGNISQGEKWNPALRAAAVEKYLRLARQADREFAPQLQVWPETATPFYLFAEAAPTRLLRQGLAPLGGAFVIGSPAVEPRGAERVYFNSAYLLPADGGAPQRYDKAHLVPFGEYVPLQRWLPFVGKLVAQVGDFARGPVGATLAWEGRRLGVQICYEIIFPALARAQAASGAGLLLNLTNDAWYGRSSAPYQHFAITVARAVENRRALVRSANTGISGFVDPVGRVVAATPLFEEAVVGASLPLMTEQSLYTRWGDLFAGTCLLAVLAASALAAAARLRRP